MQIDDLFRGEKMEGAMTTKYDELLTVEEVAKLIKTSKNTVYDLMNRGLLDYLVLGRRKVRRYTLEKFLEEYDGYDLSDLDAPKKIDLALIKLDESLQQGGEAV